MSTLETTPESVIQSTVETSQEEQALKAAEEAKAIEAKKAQEAELQAAYTRTRQNEIDLAVKLASKDKSSILDIKDVKLQNKVIGEIYGLSNIEEVKAIYGEEFYKSDDEKTEDDTVKLQREIALMKHNSEKEKIERAIKDYKRTNPELVPDAQSEEQLRGKLSLLSHTIPAEERVELAGKLAFGNTNKVNEAYKELQTLNTSDKGTAGAAKEESKTPTKQKQDALRDLLFSESKPYHSN